MDVPIRDSLKVPKLTDAQRRRLHEMAASQPRWEPTIEVFNDLVESGLTEAEVFNFFFPPRDK